MYRPLLVLLVVATCHAQYERYNIYERPFFQPDILKEMHNDKIQELVKILRKFLDEELVNLPASIKPLVESASSVVHVIINMIGKEFLNTKANTESFDFKDAFQMIKKFISEIAAAVPKELQPVMQMAQTFIDVLSKMFNKARLRTNAPPMEVLKDVVVRAKNMLAEAEMVLPPEIQPILSAAIAALESMAKLVPQTLRLASSRKLSMVDVLGNLKDSMVKATMGLPSELRPVFLATSSIVDALSNYLVHNQKNDPTIVFPSEPPPRVHQGAAARPYFIPMIRRRH